VVGEDIKGFGCAAMSPMACGLLASFQIIQQRLVSMLADLTAMQLYCLQIGRLAEAGRLTETVAGLAKMHNTRKARAIAADARDTFEGTETMQTLIVGRVVTGIGAFALRS
jgi:glutaryl-CoA dehydrogenase